ncbi:YgaP family membrane protein [Candidatus Nitrospira salsa]
MQIPRTTTRVAEHTDPQINEDILNRTKHNIVLYASAGRSSLDRRLMELDEEWDIERVLEANAASFSLVGLVLGTFAHRRWFLLPAAVCSFLLQHSIQGWCPPVPLFRRLGVRTSAEIQQERHALKALRGDYQDIQGLPDQTDHAHAPKASAAFEAAGNHSSNM